jgi:predicted Fe-Mo cluster-binding NifX family protein
MNIAIAVDGNSMASPVSEQFERCSNLLIVNAGTMKVTIIPNPEASDKVAGEHLGQAVLRYDCEAVITGLIQPAAFNILADAFVTRYLGTGYDAATALDRMHNRKLDLIRNINGSGGCAGPHHH